MRFEVRCRGLPIQKMCAEAVHRIQIMITVILTQIEWGLYSSDDALAYFDCFKFDQRMTRRSFELVCFRSSRPDAY